MSSCSQKSCCNLKKTLNSLCRLKEEVRKYALDHTFKETAKKFGIHHSTVSGWVKARERGGGLGLLKSKIFFKYLCIRRMGLKVTKMKKRIWLSFKKYFSKHDYHNNTPAFSKLTSPFLLLKQRY